MQQAGTPPPRHSARDSRRANPLPVRRRPRDGDSRWHPVRDRLVAAALAASVQALVLGGLASQLSSPLPPRRVRPMQVHWIAAVPVPPAPALADPPAPDATIRQDAGAAATGDTAAVSNPAAAARVEPAPDPVARPARTGGALTAQYVDQVAQWAARNPGPPPPAPDLLAPRGTGLAAAPPGRFRMRSQLAPADVVGFVGTLFGGADYRPDACPEMRRNVEALAQDGDSELLRDELARERALCW